MVVLDWLARILDRRFHATAPILHAPGPTPRAPTLSPPAAQPQGGVQECPHCHSRLSRLSDFDLESG
jgi:hypothetical protein